MMRSESNNCKKCFGTVTALDGVDFAVPAGIGARTARSQRGRQDHCGADPHHDPEARRRPWPRCSASTSSADPQAVRERIGLAGQYAAVDENLTGHENLWMVGKLSHLSPKTIRPRAGELLERFDLEHAAARPVRTYSGGMRRRLDLAAALVHRPEVLFLDEPTTGLDPQGRTGLWHVIEELVREGTTVLLTTQYLEEADCLADNIVVIDHGHVIAEGTAAQLKARLGATIVEVGFDDVAAAQRARGVLAATRRRATSRPTATRSS